ncbi:MAG: sigma-70 family RNA polymerase sigma factor [Candidatus Hydrogenedentes bacterium]|nr:sigma-70 family RNA polymerase sigma factor [Candidatus Hydrogenedentota bacterium]
MAPTDLMLLNRWQKERDAEAFAEIVRRHAGMVHGACARVLGGRMEAEDVAQECFLALAQGAKPREHLAGWLYRVAVNRALDLLRAEKRRAGREQQFGALAPVEGGGSEADEVLHAIDAAIAALPDKLRTPLLLHFLEGRTHEAIAAEAGLTRSTISYRIAKAIEQVRRQLARVCWFRRPQSWLRCMRRPRMRRRRCWWRG